MVGFFCSLSRPQKQFFSFSLPKCGSNCFFSAQIYSANPSEELIGIPRTLFPGQGGRETELQNSKKHSCKLSSPEEKLNK